MDNWNISKEDGFKKAYNTSIKILENNNYYLTYSEFIYLLNEKTKNEFKFKNKKKPLSKFLKYHLSDIKLFFKLYNDFDLIKNDDQIYIRYNKIESEWIIIDDDYY